MATMVEVAKRAGVSTSTVSHVINGTRRVDPATRRRVERVIAETGYRQDALARAMRRSRTDSIGLVVSDAGEPAYAEMVRGVEEAVSEVGMTLLLADSAEDSERERRAVRSLLERRVDGLILARSASSSDDLTRTLLREKRPIVLLDRLHLDLPLDQVGADNRESMRMLLARLVTQGHRRFVLVAGDTRVPTLLERHDGFVDGLRDAELAPSEQVIVAGAEQEETSRALGAALRSSGATAIIACSTPLAALALRELESAGLSTPQDIAFATFDGFAYPDLLRPRLTTVHQPAFEMGVNAVRLLRQRLDDPDAAPRTVRLRQVLKLRETTESYRPTREA